ncbi:MAG TPA: alpha-glucosidase C-terminal domain-containing protein, partial [Pyrinomonadaceae bacterium]|nr:alpha-glucosidase C-terminal domain-containing protein [Pyrinomonadaceae bacterium]
PALFEKLPVFWAFAERRPEFPRFYKQMIALRRGSNGLRRGSLEWLHNSDETRVVSYLRRTPDEEVLVVINLSSRPFVGSIEAQAQPGFTDVTPDVGQPLPPDVFNPERTARDRTVGLPVVALDAWGYRIFRRNLK